MNLRKDQNGSSLVVVLSVMVAAAGLSTLMIQTSERDTESFTSLAVSSNKLWAAESAMEAARWAVKNVCTVPPTPPVDIVNDRFDVRFTETPPGSGTYVVAATVFDTVVDSDQEYRVSRKVTASGVDCRQASPLPPSWPEGVTACEWVKASGSSTMSYDSCTLAGNEEDRAGIRVLNDGGYVTKTGSGRINGNLTLPGEGAYVEMSDSSKVKGEIQLTGARGTKGYFKHTGSGDVRGSIHVPGDFILTGNSDIYGDVHAGGTVSIARNARVHGTTRDEVVNPTPTVAGVCDPYDVDNLIEAARPQAGSNLGDFQKSGSANVTWTPGTYFYNSFTLSGSGDVLLSTSGNDARSERDDRRCHAGHHARHRHHHDNDGNDNEGRHGDRDRDHDRDRDRDDDHGDSDNVGNGDQHADFYLFVDGPFRMSGSAKLVLGAGAHLTIYHTGGRDHDQDFTIHGSSDLVATASPGQTEIYSNTTGVLSVAGSGDLAAAIYAPKAAVRVAGSGDLYGASHSKTFEVTGSGGIKYDRYLGEAVSDVAGGINVTVSGWAEEFVVR